MTSTWARIFGFSAAIIAVGSVALLAGCKGTTSADPGGEKHEGPVPHYTILPAWNDAGKPIDMNPLTDKIWVSSPWYNLVPPSDTTRTTPPVRAAMVYDATNLYVAFVSETVPPPATPISQDIVSVYLDTTPEGDGRDIAKLSVALGGQVSCTWIRSGSVAQRREDGSPDKTHPYSTFPKHPVAGLTAKTMSATQNGSPVWMAVMSIPISSLPGPLKQKVVVGSQWKINLIRSICTVDAGSGAEHLQANLSQVCVEMQPVSPYRMASVTLGGAAEKK